MNDCSASNLFKQLAKEHFLHRFGAPQNDAPHAARAAQGVQLGLAGRRTQVILLDTLVPLAVCVVAVNRGNRTAARVARETCDCTYCAGIERYVPYTAEESAATTRCLARASGDGSRSSCVSPPTSARRLDQQVLAEGHGWSAGMIPSELCGCSG